MIKLLEETCRKLTFKSEVVEKIMREIGSDKKFKLFKRNDKKE